MMPLMATHVLAVYYIHKAKKKTTTIVKSHLGFGLDVLSLSLPNEMLTSTESDNRDGRDV